MWLPCHGQACADGEVDFLGQSGCGEASQGWRDWEFSGDGDSAQSLNMPWERQRP